MYKKYIFTSVATQILYNQDGEIVEVNPNVFTYTIDASSKGMARAIGIAYCENAYPEDSGYLRPILATTELLEDFLAKQPLTESDIS